MVSYFRKQVSSYPGLLLAAIALLTIITFASGLSNFFTAEDFYFLSTANQPLNQTLQSMMNSSRIWPVGTVYRWILFQFAATSPVPYHLFSLLIHVANVVLVYYVVRFFSGRRSVGLVAALVFSLYPRHHQPVFWMTASQVLVFTGFGLVSLYAFGKFKQAGSLKWYFVCLISLILAVATQEGAVTLFPLFLVVDLIFPQPASKGILKTVRAPRFYYKYVPILLVLGGFLWMNFGGVRAYKLSTEEMSAAALAQAGVSGDSYHVNKIGGQTIRDFAAYITYAALPQIPLRSLDPGFETILLAAGVALTLLIIFIKGNPLARFGVIWMGVALLPYVFFAPFGNADRYFYFASVGFAITAGSVLWAVYQRICRDRVWVTMGSAGLAAVLVLYGASAFIQIQQRNVEWQTAGQMAANLAQQVMDLYPNPGRGDILLFAGELPTQYGQAYIYNGGGICPELALAYGANSHEFQIFQTTNPAVIDYLKTAKPVANSSPRLHVCVYEDGSLQDKTNAVHTEQLLQPETWFR